jgi:2,3-dihydroxyethylbenzene 1,2-dioxygenase
MPTVTELGYVRFGVSKLDAWKQYLTELIGLELRDDIDDGKLWARLDGWHHRFTFEQNEVDDLVGIGLRTAGPEEFRDMQTALKAAAVPFEVGSEELAIERRVLELMLLRDPGGNPIEIFHGPMMSPNLPFYPARRRFGGFVTGAAGAGHLLIRHGGVAESYEFYKLLGMRSASQFRVPLPGAPAPMAGKFMHCNVPGAREHTIAFGLPSVKSCNHLMIEVESIDDLMVTYQLVKDAGYPMMIDLGRHANDEALSFYAMTPSGFAIEIAWGCGPISEQSYLLNDDYYGHAPNADLPAMMGDVDEVRKPKP